MYNSERAIGCVIGYNAVIKAIRYVDSYEQIPPRASQHLRRVLEEVYGRKMYKYYSHRRAKLRLVA